MEEKRNRWKEASRSGNLRIKGTQKVLDQEDVSEIVTNAKYVVKDGIRYLFYREYMENGAYQQVRLSIEDQEVILKKSGMGQSMLHFSKGTMKQCHYQSPVGMMDLISKTHSIRLKEGGHSLLLKMEYSLYMHDQLMSDYEMEICWEENKE